MVQNICNRWESLLAIQTKNLERSLFDENVENDIIDDESTENIILNHLKQYSTPVRMNIFLANLFTSKGVFTKWDILQKSLRNLEGCKRITLRRSPSITKTGKKSTFINESPKEKHLVEIWINR